MSVLLTSTFDPKAIKFSTLEKNKKGGKVVYVGLDDAAKTRVVLQTPAMVMPFGINPYQESPGGDIQSYSVDVSFRTADVDPIVAEFQAKVKELDEILIKTAQDNCETWFGPTMKRELIPEFYRKLINDKNPQYPPVLKVKVGVGMNGEPSAQFYDESRAPVGIEYLSKGSTVKMIVELSSVWFVNKTFGATFRLVQAAVVSKPRRLQGYAFQEEEVVGEKEEPEMGRETFVMGGVEM